jgi:hypothetical protein
MMCFLSLPRGLNPRRTLSIGRHFLGEKPVVPSLWKAIA